MTQGPYLLHFGPSIPKIDSLNVSFYADLGLLGYVDSNSRGALTGKASGLQPGFPAVIGLNNSDYQFWASADDYGIFTAKHIPSGTYEMALYQQEFAAATTTVSIKPGGATATQNIQATSTVITTKRNTIFQLGEYDGQPFEFLNGD
ncbi:hypothetical protein BDV24DRAFT_166074 [Aspergillus arachidicola]|uniref:Rhamnogalacturonan lyase domain-containing protein n=1 Tax=Aspergillus arachidicola TaxID=656916 RepID=A0A5N6XZZ0_9EURO|nr:hypothetical protein BDV24DRAFT_166074 [Aspergillus arachidicola]